MESKREKRTQLLTGILDQIRCLRDYEISRVLGVGTVGTIFLVTKGKGKKKQDFAAKIQILKTSSEEKVFEQEVAKQRAFAPFAPHVVESCVETIGRKNPPSRIKSSFTQMKLGILVMELSSGTLDEKLSQRLSKGEVEELGAQMAELLNFAAKRKLIHGDTALFNFGFVERDGEEKLVFMDFDRASLDTDLFSEFGDLDTLRLLTELNPGSRSQGTKKLHKETERLLKEVARKKWLPLLKEKITDPELQDEEWTRLYCGFCEAAGVLCLEGNSCKRFSKKVISKKGTKKKNHTAKSPKRTNYTSLRKRTVKRNL